MLDADLISEARTLDSKVSPTPTPVTLMSHSYPLEELAGIRTFGKNLKDYLDLL